MIEQTVELALQSRPVHRMGRASEDACPATADELCSGIVSEADYRQVARPKWQIPRLVLASFVFTFIAARIVVLLIMLRCIPSLYLHVRGTHVHHLNYGIFLLSLVGGYLLFKRPRGRGLAIAAIGYGVGLALTFDEFGMWMHLGGPYWQRASFDAVVIITALLGVLVYAPMLRRFRPAHWATAVVLTLALAVFTVVMIGSLRQFATRRISPILQQVESYGPT